MGVESDGGHLRVPGDRRKQGSCLTGLAINILSVGCRILYELRRVASAGGTDNHGDVLAKAGLQVSCIHSESADHGVDNCGELFQFSCGSRPVAVCSRISRKGGGLRRTQAPHHAR